MAKTFSIDWLSEETVSVSENPYRAENPWLPTPLSGRVCSSQDELHLLAILFSLSLSSLSPAS